MNNSCLVQSSVDAKLFEDWLSWLASTGANGKNISSTDSISQGDKSWRRSNPKAFFRGSFQWECEPFSKSTYVGNAFEKFRVIS